MLKIKLIDIKSIKDERGMLSVIQNSGLPFSMKRVFWITDSHKPRGGHAHHRTMQCLICIRGSCRLNIDDGSEKKQIMLEQKMNKGIIIGPEIWHSMEKFSKDCILMSVASEEYDEKDYIRDYGDFQKRCLELRP